MAISYPTSLDTFTNPTANSPRNNPSLAQQQADQNDAIEALEAKVGVDDSAVETSLEYRVTALEGLGETGVSDGDKGDITVSSSGTVWTIDNDAVTYAKMQNVSATNRILGRISSGAGNTEELTAANVMSILGITSSADELNILDGVTASAAELNALDGITATVTELNYTDGVTSAIQTQLDAKSTASKTETLTNKTIDANGTGNSITNIEVADLAAGVLDTDLSSVAATDTTIPSAKATKAALDLKAPLASPSFTGTVTLPTGLTGVLRADSGVVSTDSDVTDLVSAASATAQGKVELATDAETATGTDTARAITPANLKSMILDEDTMTSDSAVKVPTQQSVKAYVDNAISGVEGGGVADGDKGDITVSGTGATWTIDNGVVTYAKMQDVSATSRVLGRITADAGDVEELTSANLMTILGITASAAELNALDGITSTVTELNYTDGVTSAIQTQLDGKVDVGGETMTGPLVAADHGTASTDQVINVCYGTSATPPTASDTTEGTLYIQYTA